MYDIDDVLMDRYRVFGYRMGGMGIVYFLTDLITGRDFAAKTYRPDYEGKEKLIERFRSELEFSLQMGEHTNVLTVHFIENIDNQLYLFTDYIDGGEKGSNIRERIDNEEMDPGTAILFAYQIAKGMEFLNSRGVIAHLDLKPSNILVTEDDIVKISDFGLARDADPFHYHPTTENAGSWPYMSPEQFRGEFVDTRSDIYSFGMILYEMLTGYLPFKFNMEAKSKKEIYEFLKSFHTSHSLGEDFYWHGLPDLPDSNVLRKSIGNMGDPSLLKSSDLGIVVSGCIARERHKRFYKFTYIRESLEFGFSRYLNRTSDDERKDRDEFQRGLDLQKLQQDSKALHYFNKALKKQPNNALIWCAAAVSLWNKDMHDEAIRFARKAIALKPNDPEIENTLYPCLKTQWKEISE